eukprot:614071-Rhodomonas_salina.3
MSACPCCLSSWPVCGDQSPLFSSSYCPPLAFISSLNLQRPLDAAPQLETLERGEMNRGGGSENEEEWKRREGMGSQGKGTKEMSKTCDRIGSSSETTGHGPSLQFCLQSNSDLILIFFMCILGATAHVRRLWVPLTIYNASINTDHLRDLTFVHFLLPPSASSSHVRVWLVLSLCRYFPLKKNNLKSAIIPTPRHLVVQLYSRVFV